MTVLVTGGSGVVGAAVVRHLVSAGEHVRCLSRSEASDAKLVELGAEPVRGDVCVPDPKPFERVDLVYHLAGLNQMCPRRPAALVETNVNGSLNVLRSAEAAGVPRLVYTSSAAAIGEEHGTVGTENSPHRGSYLSHYERSKHLAELAVMAEQTSVEVITVNPSSVQGPGRASGTAKLILDVVKGRLPFLIDTRLSIVDIDDCARGHLLAAANGRPGERYILNSFTLPIREAIELLESELGCPIKVRYLPASLAMAAATVIGGGSKVAGRRPPICREMVRTVRNGHSYDGSKATRQLGLRYTPPGEVLGRLVRWFRDQGMIER